MCSGFARVKADQAGGGMARTDHPYVNIPHYQWRVIWGILEYGGYALMQSITTEVFNIFLIYIW